MSSATPIDDLVEELFREMKYDAQAFNGLSGGKENQIKDMTKSFIATSVQRGDPLSKEDIVLTMLNLSKMSQDHFEALAETSKGLSIKDAAFTMTLMPHATPEQLQKLTLTFSRDPKEMSEKERLEFQHELKELFKDLIKTLDPENKLSPELVDKLATECAQKFMAKPGMNTLHEVLNDIKKAVGNELKKDQTETHGPEALQALPPPDQIKGSEIPGYAGVAISLTALAGMATKVDTTLNNYDGLQAEHAAVLLQTGPEDRSVKEICEAAGVEPHANAPRPSPYGQA